MLSLLKKLFLTGVNNMGYSIINMRKKEYLIVKNGERIPDTPSSAPSPNVIASPIEQFIDTAYQCFTTGHFDKHYVEWRMRRIRKVLEIQGLDFSGKRILELGGGFGDIGAFFAELGANVISIDGRAVNCNFANLKYRNLKTFKSLQQNLEEDFSDIGHFDIVISFGSLEVIYDLDQYMKSCCKVSNCVLFETGVLDSEDPYGKVQGPTPTEELKNFSEDHALFGASAASPFYIERIFKENGFSAEKFFDPDLNCGPHCYDWVAGDSRTDITKRRFWRFKKLDD